MKIYVIRHGETNWNKEGRLQGRTDIELNENGIKQAENARKLLKAYKIDLIVSSPLKRAMKTAQIINEEKNCPIILDKRIEERGYGDIEGRIRKEITDEVINSKQLDNYKINKKYMGIEPIQDLCSRVWSLIDDLRKDYTDRNILLVTHGGTIRAIDGYFYGVDENGIIQNPGLKNCEIKEYEL